MMLRMVSAEEALRMLDDDRRAHSLAVGAKASGQVGLVAPELRDELMTAATLHDVGYAQVDTGLHALDGARFLQREGFSPVICRLVLCHTASHVEAKERGLDLALFEDFAVDADLGRAHRVLWWADLTTGPQGQSVTVERRLAEIQRRYGPDDVVSRFIRRAEADLLEAGQSPVGSIHV